jgi:drug/metabolite transporter (DMT)-like permease
VAERDDKVMLGIAMRLLAVLLLSVLYALIKLAEARGANLAEIMFWRQGVAVPVTLGYMLVSGAGLGAIVLREPTGWHRWGAVVVGFIGVLIVVQPGSGHIPVWGALCGLTSSLFVAYVAIQLRQIGKVDQPVTTVFWFSALSMVPMTAIYPFFAQGHDVTTWAVLLGMGVFGGLGQIAFTAALKYAPVSAVMPMDYSSLLWATLLGWLLFDRLPTPWTWLGAPVIVASGGYIVWRERRVLRQPLTQEAMAD